VENPGNYEVFFQTTILDVIFLAGGTTEDANLNKIKIVSFTGQNSREVKINIKKLLQSKDVSSIPIVVPGDVVYIPKKFMNWKKIVGLIKDATTFAMLYYIIIRSKNS
jgi:protein involved in polysaccharide export with SLBB domain